ncbi:hypothetical protein ES705_36574 [subsurface metagenome]
MEENIDLYHYEDHKKITVLAKRTGKEGEYKARCINPSHEDIHPSMGINTIKGVYNCLVCNIKGVTWEKYLEGRGKGKGHKSKRNKNYMQEKEDREEKSRIMSGLDIDLENWEGYSPEQRAEIIQGIPLDLCFLSEEEKTIAIGTLVKAGIFRKTELQRRIQKIKSLIRKVKMVKKGDEKEDKTIKTRTLIPGLIHLIKEGEKVGYLLQNSGNFYIDESFTGEDGVNYKPKSDLPIYYCGADILEESREVDYSFLLNDVIKFIKKYLELPKESGYLILGLWVFYSYLIEKFDTTPILYFYGVYETGKSRAGEVLKELGFRCEMITSPTEAVLFRGADYFKGSLIVDQVKIWGSEGNKDIATLIKARYKRGLVVPRINLNKSGEDQIEYFDTFGPMVICTDETMPQDIESRCIIFQMRKNNNPGVEGSIDKDLAKSIRNKLIVFRANFAEKELKELEPVSRRRLNELLYPLYRILTEVAPERRDEFKLVIKEIEQKREGEEGFTLEADIVNEIVKYYNKTGEESFLTSELVNRLNEGKREKELFSDRLISLRIKRLGFEKIRLEGGKRGFRIDLDLLEKVIPNFKAIKIERKEQSFHLK